MWEHNVVTERCKRQEKRNKEQTGHQDRRQTRGDTKTADKPMGNKDRRQSRQGLRTYYTLVKTTGLITVRRDEAPLQVTDQRRHQDSERSSGNPRQKTEQTERHGTLHTSHNTRTDNSETRQDAKTGDKANRTPQQMIKRTGHHNR